MKRILGWFLVVALAGAAVFLVPTLFLKPWSIDHFYARIFVEFMLRHPMIVTQLGLFDGLPVNPYGGRLDDLSDASREKEARFVDRNLAMLRSYDTRGMKGDVKLSRDVLEWFLASQAEGRPFLYHDYPVNQLFGVQSTLPRFMLETHPLRRPRDATDYVTRVGRFGVAIDQTLAGLAHRESLGVVPPRFVLERVNEEMRRFAGTPAKENPLYAHFDSASARIEGLKPERRTELLARLEREIDATVDPAYRRLIEFCTRLERSATTDDGVWKLPNGDAFYEYCLRQYTTSALSPDSIHALGLSEVARIEGEMRTVLRSLGEPADEPGTSLLRLMREPRFRYAKGDSARERILADYRAILDDATRRSAALFDVRPKAGVLVERVAPLAEATSPAAYYTSATIEGGRPGKFFVNLRDPSEVVRADMRTLAFHEAIPGHHFQLSIAQELKGVPFFRRVIPFTAYIEGWALYAERLAYENGFHPTAYDSLGALRAELFRAARLVVDTGIHRKRWTRQQAIDYMVRVTGTEEAAAVAEVERYVVHPGQACAYKLGELEIRVLRERARAALGERFDLRRFHNAVLTHGALPLGLLERVVDEWIDTERGAHSGPPQRG